MSKVIFKSPYAKSKGHAATNLRYIAERDGVDKSKIIQHYISTKSVICNVKVLKFLHLFNPLSTKTPVIH